ncbi:serine threonine kinase [Fusarium denticulatum]|uniref:Serine threonine kinase n=1 Tax=Fusarium denticulatum TaxID=48507 RepID=A0A8H6CWI3_9HYPO|nr:serine threonine kinase [Fusarium denticulatum]
MTDLKTGPSGLGNAPRENYKYDGNGLVTLNDVFGDLGKLIRDYSVEGLDGRFWTDKLLRHILSRERIKAELKRPEHGFNDLEVDGYVDKIHPPDVKPSADRTPPGAFLKVFGLLVLQERCGDIRRFVNAEFNDQQLPIRVENNTVYPLAGPDLPIACFEGWRTSEKEYFESHQWKIDTPYFSSVADEPLKKHHLHKSACKPWRRSRETSFEPRNDDSDNMIAFGRVTRVEIHPTSHAYPHLLKSTLHRINHNNESKFQEEWEMLKRFNGLKHPHLVTALCAFCCADERGFIFPGAICDLGEYLEKSEPPRHSKATIWISDQLLGLIGALQTIHNPEHVEQGVGSGYGRHGDIKSDNILCFKRLGDKGEIILVISDFGLSTFNSVKSRSNIPNHKVLPIPGYCPPECHIEGGTISRAFDIWTLGCLFLDQITWFLGGPRYVEDFDQARTTMFINGANNNIFFAFKRRPDKESYTVQVKTEVVEWIIKLHQHPDCSKFLHDALDIISREMLVVIAQGRNRSSSGKLLDAFRMLSSKCTRKEEYVIGDPWTGKKAKKAKDLIRKNNIAVDAMPIQSRRL